MRYGIEGTKLAMKKYGEMKKRRTKLVKLGKEGRKQTGIRRKFDSHEKYTFWMCNTSHKKGTKVKGNAICCIFGGQAEAD